MRNSERTASLLVMDKIKQSDFFFFTGMKIFKEAVTELA